MNNTVLISNIIRNVSVGNKLKAGSKAVLTAASILLFLGLTILLSFKIKNYVTETISVELINPIVEIPAEITSEEISSTITIKKGDTLNTILIRQKLPKQEILQIMKLAEQKRLTSNLKIGQQVTFDYNIEIIENEEDDLNSEIRTLNRMTFVIDKLKSLEIVRERDNFIAKSTVVPLHKFMTKSSAVIKSSLISTLKSMGMPTNSIVELINSYSYQLDFQREIKSGDVVTVILEKFMTEDGKFSHYGSILHASLNLSGKEYNVYRYSYDGTGKNFSFFSENGKSVKGSLLRTPVNVIKISSRYGKRKDPIGGYTKMHKGVDFRAPVGTPIYAAGNGVVTEACFKSGYGRFVQIKHSPTLSTAYAHASKFAPNLKVGSRVKQGQIIAYVGKSGRTTGPHLHYEVKVQGKHVNPMSIKTTPGIELKGKKLANFNQFKNKVRNLNSKLGQDVAIEQGKSIL